MTIEERIQATAKNIEGKVQEVVGEITGNPEDKAQGQAKQSQAQLEHEIQNMEDQIEQANK